MKQLPLNGLDRVLLVRPLFFHSGHERADAAPGNRHHRTTTRTLLHAPIGPHLKEMKILYLILICMSTPGNIRSFETAKILTRN